MSGILCCILHLTNKRLRNHTRRMIIKMFEVDEICHKRVQIIAEHVCKCVVIYNNVTKVKLSFLLPKVMNNYKTDHTILYYDLRDLTNFEI